VLERWNKCFYINPDCDNEPAHYINEYHVDLWVGGYHSCKVHISYLLNYIKRCYNHAKINRSPAMN